MAGLPRGARNSRVQLVVAVEGDDEIPGRLPGGGVAQPDQQTEDGTKTKDLGED